MRRVLGKAWQWWTSRLPLALCRCVWRWGHNFCLVAVYGYYCLRVFYLARLPLFCPLTRKSRHFGGGGFFCCCRPAPIRISGWLASLWGLRGKKKMQRTHQHVFIWTLRSIDCLLSSSSVKIFCLFYTCCLEVLVMVGRMEKVCLLHLSWKQMS